MKYDDEQFLALPPSNEAVYGAAATTQSSLQAATTEPAAVRDRYFDVLRAVALIRVVVFHMFPLAWIAMVFPAMGVMFALGGSLMARSVDRSAQDAVTGRVRRLLPALWVVGAILIPVALWAGWSGRPGWVGMLLWVLPIAPPPGPEWAEPVTGLLWYLTTYLWLVILSPASLRLYRRARVLTAVLPLASLAALEMLPWSLNDAAGSVVTDLLTFAACWILGFAHRDGDLQRLPKLVVILLSTVCTAVGIVWTVTHPGDDGVDLANVPLAYGVYSVGFVLLLLRLPPPMDWLDSRRLLTGAVNLLNARAVTIYLWHNVAIALSFPLGDVVQVWRVGDAFMMAGYFGVALVLLAGFVTVLGWVEDVAARRRVRLLPLSPSATRPRRVAPAWSGPIP